MKKFLLRTVCNICLFASLATPCVSRSGEFEYRCTVTDGMRVKAEDVDESLSSPKLRVDETHINDHFTISPRDIPEGNEIETGTIKEGRGQVSGSLVC